MDLEDQQNILASLYVSEKYRTNYNYKEFNSLNLTEKQCKKLIEEINEFAKSLINKRRNMVKRLIPYTVKYILGTKFNPLFFSYAKNSQSNGNQRYLLDSLGFLKHLKKAYNFKFEEMSNFKQIYEYEYSKLSFMTKNRYLNIIYISKNCAQLMFDEFSYEDRFAGKSRFCVWAKIDDNIKMYREIIFK